MSSDYWVPLNDINQQRLYSEGYTWRDGENKKVKIISSEWKYISCRGGDTLYMSLSKPDDTIKHPNNDYYTSTTSSKSIIKVLKHGYITMDGDNYVFTEFCKVLKRPELYEEWCTWLNNEESV